MKTWLAISAIEKERKTHSTSVMVNNCYYMYLANWSVIIRKENSAVSLSGLNFAIWTAKMDHPQIYFAKLFFQFTICAVPENIHTTPTEGI